MVSTYVRAENRGPSPTSFNHLLVWVLLGFWGFAALATPPPRGVAPVTVPAGGFAIDGNLVVGSTNGDWVPSANASAGSFVLNAKGDPLNLATTLHYKDLWDSASDTTFLGGLKWTDDPNTWKWGSGNTSSKTDINNVLLHITSDANAHTWVIIAADRLSTSGDSYIDFEFLQNSLQTNSGGFASAGPNGGRTVNDVLLSLAFTSGGSVADFFAWRWQPNGNGGFAYVDATASLPAGGVFVAANPTNALVPYTAFGSTNYAANAFAEAALDLTALLGNFDPCLSIGIKSIMVKTKTSQSGSATISDFIAPIQYSVRLGPSADAGPDQARCREGDSTAFPLQGRATPGLYPIASTNWTVVSGDVTLDDPSSLTTTAHVSVGSATLRLTVVQANGCTETDEVVLSVVPLPGCLIAGPAVVCPQSRTQFQGPPGLTAYAWSVSGGASISGPTNAATVTVVAGTACATNFNLALTVLSNRCPSTCSFEGLVNDTVPPTLSCPPDRVLECPADTRTNATGVAVGQDDCGAVFVSYSDSVTDICGGTKLIARTWTATDLCGNSTNAVQTITLRDTIAPSLAVPANRVLQCPADTSTNATGMATASDACGAVIVTCSDVVSNTCGGAKVITRTWTATDGCNVTNRVQLITVQDTTAPSLAVPVDRVLDCPADTSTNNTGLATALDACGSVVVTCSDVVSNSCGGTKVIRRTWTAVDDCGNQTNRLQTITVRDNTAPSLAVPADRVLQCPADTSTNSTGTATALDACGAVTITYSDVVSNTCGGTKLIARTWTATDGCNVTNRVQLITVVDTTAPLLSVPADRVLDCPADTSTNNTGVATASDACSAVVVSYSDVVSNSCGGTKTIRRTWTAVDSCSNAVSRLQTITVRDNTAPSFAVPADRVLECPADTSTNNTGTATALDVCGAVVVSYSDVVSNTCGGAQVITRTWTASDGCNLTNRVQKITVRDSTPPTLAMPEDRVLECPADTTTNNTGVATASDACGSVAVKYSDVVNNICGGSKLIRRTWTAVDSCGNATNRVQTITVQDTTAPSLMAPADRIVECSADTRTNATGVALSTDSCSPVTILYSDSVSNGCGGTRVISRTWTAVDPCGNSTNGVQTITVRDTTPPSLKLPASVVLDCPGDTRTNATGVATSLDGCGSVVVTYSDVVSNGCSSTRTVWRTWTAVDQCGNTTNGLQTIVVRDITAPRVTLPNPAVQCPGDVPPAYADLSALRAAGGTATDACSTTLAFGLVTDTGLVGTCPGRVTRVYRVADECGNATTVTQTITVDDTTPPVLTCPASLTVECGSSLDPANLGGATATDNCDTNVNLTYTDASVPSTYNIRWMAADPVPNSAPYLPTYTKVAPGNMPCPDAARLTGRAADPLRNAVAYGPTASQLDALTSLGGEPMCFGQIVPFEALIEVSGGATRPENGTIEFTADWSTHTTSNDEFGYDKNYMIYCAFVDYADPGTLDPNNNAKVESYRATLVNAGTVNEKIEGTFRVSGLDSGDRVVVEIWAVLKSAAPRNFGGTIAADLVSAQKATTPPQSITTGAQTVSIGNLSKIGALPAPQPQPPLPPVPPQPEPLPGFLASVMDRTWTATDDCGNQRTCVQRITVRDTLPPILSVPADQVLECPADTTTNSTGVATASDACGSVVVTYSDVVSNGCGGTKVVARTWTVTDGYSTTNRVQMITVQDTTPPALAVPADRVLEYPADTSTNNIGVATASDACGAVVVSYSDVVSNTCGAAKVIVRTWTAVDDCGNTTNRLQTITVRDTSAPSLAVPTDRVLEYPADTSTNHTGVATASDACGAVVVSYSDVVSNTCGEAKVILRTWTASDGCNSTNRVQLITVVDSTPPTLTLPSDRVLDCPADTSTNSTGVATAWDACGSVVLTCSDVVSNNCGGTKVIARTWTAVDSCGNQASRVQTITLRDTSAPSLNVPADRVLECPADTTTNHTGAATALDACGTVTITYSDVVSNTCGGARVILRTWTAADGCNSTNRVQTITVKDSVPPVLSATPNRTILAGQNLSFDEPVATDLCGAATVHVVNTVTNVTSTNAVLVTRTWEGADSCGNTATGQQTILIQAPLEAPRLTGGPKSQTVSCGGNTVLSVTTGGSGPMTYQWRLNGTNIAGATGSYLGLNGLQATNAGLYSVLISNGAGSVLSAPAVVDVAPVLGRQTSGSHLTLSWAAPFILQAAEDIAGPYEDVPGAVSPHTVDTKAGTPQRFFRLSSPPFSVTATPGTNAQLQLSTPGVPGYNLVIQASTNLLDWVNVATNPSPVLFVDDSAGASAGRFYRAVIAQTIGQVRLARPVISAQPKSQSINLGGEAVLTVESSGPGPLAYQWRLNGTNIAGATGSSLALSHVQFASAGLYSVVVRNGGGTVVSPAAVVNVLPTLAMQRNGNWLTLTWPSPFILQSAPGLLGPYTDVPAASSPYVLDLSVGPQKVYRLRSAPFQLTAAPAAAGKFAFSTPGVPGCNLLIQASTNLTTWVNVATNPSPCLFLENNPGLHSKQFYRALIAR